MNKIKITALFIIVLATLYGIYGIFSVLKLPVVGGGTGFGGGSMFSSTGGSTDSFSAGTLTQGGGINATSTVNSAETFLASDFDVENIIDYTLNVQDATLSFPASSTLSAFIPTAGQTRTIYIRNATTTAAMDLTIAGGTGVLLKKATSTATIVGDTDGANYAQVDLTRKANTDIEALLTLFID